MVFETLHLDLEGGVGERRTTPAPNTRMNTINDADQKGDKGETGVKIHLEEGRPGSDAVAARKRKKAVGFASGQSGISFEF